MNCNIAWCIENIGLSKTISNIYYNNDVVDDDDDDDGGGDDDDKLLLWLLEDLSKADATLSSNFPICSLRYSTKDVNLVIGGQYNGQVSLWDIRRGKMPVERSVLAESHADPAYKVLWVQSKTNTEFFSTSTDGQVLWWDFRKLAEPIEQMWIDPTKKQEKAQAEGGLCLDFEPSMVG